MKSIAISFVLIILLLLVACDTSSTSSFVPASPTSQDLLTQMLDAQDRATMAADNSQRVAATAQRIAARATTQAQAQAQSTREHVILQGQQTRISQDSRATQTVFASNISATESARVANQTRYADESRATATANAANASATAQASRYTATAQAGYLEATRASASATANTNAIIAEQTRASASATATANAASASQTQVAAIAIQTRTSEETQTIASKANWERTTESVRSVGMVIGVVLFVVGGLILIGFFAYRIVVLETARRAREFRDANDELVVQMENGDWVRPGNMPGAYLPTSTKHALPAGTVDHDTTRRAQAISLMLAAQSDSSRAQIEQVIEQDDEAEPAQATAPAISIYKPFEPRPLELADAPRLALPVGTTVRGEPLWIPFQDVTHALIGGPSGMGKTNLVHGWIQSLQKNGARVDVYDGKDGLEFARYANMPNTRIIADNLPLVLGDALTEMKRRFGLLSESGATNIVDYNRERDTDDRIEHQAIVIDELYDALQDDAVLSSLETLSSKARATGIHLIMATQLPDAGSVPKILRINALLRVAFACPSHTNSNAILGYSGAEKIEKTPGRLLVFWQGKLIEAQAFKTILPPALPGGMSAKLLGEPPSPFDEETRRMVEWAVQQGGGWFVVNQVIDALGIRRGRVVRVAKKLERQGLLSPVQKDDGGQNLGRQISQKLIQMVGA